MPPVVSTKVHLTAVCHADELRFQCLGFVRQDHGLLHHIACGGEHLGNQRAAFILPLAAAAFIGKGDDGSAQGRVFQCRQQGHLVPYMDLAAGEYPSKHALVGHDALAGLLLDDAVVVALLADLGHFQHHIPNGKPAGHRQIAEVEALDDQIFAEGTVVHPDLLTERLDFFRR